jgi:hypothetical protein
MDASVTKHAYTPEGKLTVIDRATLATRSSSAYAWRYAFQTMRQDADGLYAAPGGGSDSAPALKPLAADCLIIVPRPRHENPRVLRRDRL